MSRFTPEDGHPGLAELVPVRDVYPCGRLDHDSEGLLLLSDDGAFQARVAAPESRLWKTYLAQVEGSPTEVALQALRDGLVIQGKRTRPARARLVPDPGFAPRVPPIRERREIPTAWIELSICEGRNRQVRRMTAAAGFPTLRLVRTAIGPFRLGALAPGAWREALPRELSELAPQPSRRPEKAPARAHASGPSGAKRSSHCGSSKRWPGASRDSR